MAEFVFKLPDLGEGAVEAEIVEWHVRPGAVVAEGDVIVDVMTDKANVEIPAPVGGTVVRTSGSAGDRVAVGAELAAFVVDGSVESAMDGGPAAPTALAGGEEDRRSSDRSVLARASGAKVAASPAVRRRAREAGVDLSEVTGSGPCGRVLERDFEAFLKRGVGMELGYSGCSTRSSRCTTANLTLTTSVAGGHHRRHSTTLVKARGIGCPNQYSTER